MRVAHFSVFAPNRCGLYGTVRDLILAERTAGIEAGLVALGEDNRIHPGKRDGPIVSVDEKWCESADIFVRHSGIPPEMQLWNKPIILALHGRPESSFRLERDAGNDVITATYNKAHDERYRAFVTFWPEYLLPLSMLIPPEKLYCVPAPVDLDFYAKGEDMRFEGAPRILIADIWRDDVTPFNCVWAALWFCQHYAPDGRIYIVGLSGEKEKKAFAPFLTGLEKTGFLGKAASLTPNIRDWYASCDMLVSPHVIATRSIREALASGLPVVAGSGNRFTPFTANPMDVERMAEAIRQCWESRGAENNARATAREHFSLEQAGRNMAALFARVLHPVTTARNVFVDLGGHLGESVKRFYTEVPNAETWQIHTFEPDPANAKAIAQLFSRCPNVHVHQSVAWTSDGPVTFYPGAANDGEGSTLVTGKQTGAVGYDHPVTVNGVDIGKWINQAHADRIIVKMNIEGAEYDILPHLLKTGAIDRIEQLYCQMHSAKFPLPVRRKMDMTHTAFLKAIDGKPVKAYLFDRGMEAFHVA